MAVQPSEIRSAFARRVEVDRQRAEASTAASRAALPALARCLRAFPGVRRVWSFGSLAWGIPHQRSDIDLAVEGLAPLDVFAALAALMAEAPAAVDLVRLEDAPPALRERILREGVELADAP
jgi:predicted nucleotidyltransferase